MSQLELNQHHFLPADTVGTTLVVMPRGMSSGFSARDITTEVDGLSSRIETGNFDVLIDFSQASYVGSEVLGILMKLGMSAREAGRRFIVCALSETMANVLRVSQLDSQMETYADRKSALAVLAGKPMPTGSDNLIKIYIAITGAIVLGIVLWLIFR